MEIAFARDVPPYAEVAAYLDSNLASGPESVTLRAVDGQTTVRIQLSTGQTDLKGKQAIARYFSRHSALSPDLLPLGVQAQIDDFLDICRAAQSSTEVEKAVQDQLKSSKGQFLFNSKSPFLPDYVAWDALKRLGANSVKEPALQPWWTKLTGTATAKEAAELVESKLQQSSAPQDHTNGFTATDPLVDPSAKMLPSHAPKFQSSIKSIMSRTFQQAIAKSAFGLTPQDPLLSAQVAESSQANVHYQCNNAMSVFGKLKSEKLLRPDIKSPRDVASAIVKNLDPALFRAGGDYFEPPSIAGAGFINVRVTRDFLEQRVHAFMRDGVETLAPSTYFGRRIIVDFSSPNVAKEMHVGHLRSTIIGDTLARSLEFCGADVVRLNHIGDWGTQFGMLIEYMGEVKKMGRADGIDPDTETIADLQVLYRAAKKRFDDDDGFKTRARLAVTKLQSGEPDSIRRWQRICDASRKEFQAIYDRLGVTIVERGESFYNPMLADTVDELVRMGVAAESDGAICIFVDGAENPLIIRKSDGGYGYGTTDMAALKHRLTVVKAEWIIYVTDIGQASHFDLVFAGGRKAGWLPTNPQASPRVSHCGFGLVLGEDGKKFKTRSGDVVRLVELLDEAKDKCAGTIKEFRGGASGDAVDGATETSSTTMEFFTPEELEHAAAAMGYGAVKYADLKNSRTSNYSFSFKHMLALKGDTAVYLLYAHARIASIIRKSDRDVSALAKATVPKLAHPRELELALHLCRFTEAMESMLSELMPHKLTSYLYDLSEKFNLFYQDCRVIGSGEHEDSRLVLCEATAVVMRKCFHLLGIAALYRI